MKKIIFLLLIAFVFSSLTSCAGKKKGCGLTADTTQVSTQGVVVELTE